MGLFFLTGPLFASYNALAPGDPSGSMGKKVKITFWIEFGRKSRNCEGFGICDWGLTMTLDEAVQKMTVTKTGGEGYFDDDGRFVMEFFRKYMLEETATTYFRNEFIVGENASIPQEILRKLDHPGDYVIKAGTYSVRQTAESIVVTF